MSGGERAGVETMTPALEIIAAWMQAQGDDAVDLLTDILEDAITEAHRDAVLWDGYRPERAARDRRCADAARALIAALTGGEGAGGDV